MEPSGLGGSLGARVESMKERAAVNEALSSD